MAAWRPSFRQVVIGAMALAMVAAAYSFWRGLNTPLASVRAGWAPDGYTVATANQDAAWRWTPPGDYSCRTTKCTGITVVTRTGCPRAVYAESTVLDRDGAAVGYANATTGGVAPMQAAKMVLEILEPTGTRIGPPSVSCR